MTYNVRIVYQQEGLIYETVFPALNNINEAIDLLNAAILSEYILESIYLEPNA